MGREMVRSAYIGVALASLLALGGCARFGARMDLRKGNEEYRKGKYDKAVGYYAMVPDGLPERVHAALNSGYSHMAQYRFGSKHPKDRDHATKALEYFDEYLKIRPADAKIEEFPEYDKVEEYVITLLSDAERFEDAIARLEGQLKRKPDDKAILLGIAKTYDRWAKPVKAVEYFRRWAALFPGDAAPHAHIAAYCWNMSYRSGQLMESLARNRWVDHGLEAAERAVQVNAESVEGITYKNLLLRERAKLRIDPDEVAALLKDATTLLEQAKVLRQKEKDAAEAAKATASPTPSGT